jgi:hypothetical protein
VDPTMDPAHVPPPTGRALRRILRTFFASIAKEDLRQARPPQGEISDLITRVQKLKSEIGREEKNRRGLSVWTDFRRRHIGVARRPA